MWKRNPVRHKHLYGFGVAMLLLAASAGGAAANSRCHTDYHADNTAITTCDPVTPAAAPVAASDGSPATNQGNPGLETLRFPAAASATTVPEHRAGCNITMTYCEK